MTFWFNVGWFILTIEMASVGINYQFSPRLKKIVTEIERGKIMSMWIMSLWVVQIGKQQIIWIIWSLHHTISVA